MRRSCFWIASVRSLWCFDRLWCQTTKPLDLTYWLIAWRQWHSACAPAARLTNDASPLGLLTGRFNGFMQCHTPGCIILPNVVSPLLGCSFSPTAVLVTMWGMWSHTSESHITWAAVYVICCRGWMVDHRRRDSSELQQLSHNNMNAGTPGRWSGIIGIEY